MEKPRDGTDFDPLCRAYTSAMGDIPDSQCIGILYL